MMRRGYFLRIILPLVILSGLLVGVDGCGRGRRCVPRPAPDTKKPTIRCPADITAVADDMKTTSSKVRWTTPTGHDDRDGSVTATRSGLKSGDTYPEGRTDISYSVKDRAGNRQRCSFKVIVEVHRCQPWGPQENGWMVCDPSHDMIKGTVCRFGCHPGFELVGDQEVTCVHKDKWSVRNQPVCRPKTCNRLVEPNDKTTITCTDDNKYQSACHYTCVNGYDILPGLNRVRVCSADQTWSGSAPVCVDVTPPEFTNCPSVVIGYAESSKTSGRINWNPPHYTDNAGSGGVTSVQTEGPSAGAELDVGEYKVTYLATDEQGNTASCYFKVVMKQIMCHTLYPLPYTSVSCPGGRKYGSDCTFTCMNNNTALNGPADVECVSFNHGNVRYGQWSFGQTQPYCQLVSSCPKPGAPDHGALACDTWAGGKYCQVQCQDEYLIPQSMDLLLLCTDSGGSWSSLGTDQKVPNCEKSTPLTSLFYTLQEYFYYGGDCSSSKDEIKANYLTALEKSQGDVCASVSCTTDLVEVICGNSSTSNGKRKRRSADENIVIEATIRIESKSGDIDATDVIVLKQNFIEARSESDAGNLRFGGVVLESRGIEISQPIVECPRGYFVNKYTLKCVSCGVGSYLDETLGACALCPRGQYQPLSEQTACLTCPYQTTTERFGATSVAECIAGCPPGQFSFTGTAPCSPCDVGSYSDTYGVTECTLCSGAKTTAPSGDATRAEDCYDFDLDFPKMDDIQPAVVTMDTYNAMTSYYISLWLMCSTCDAILSLEDKTGDVVLSLGQTGHLTAQINGCSLDTSADLITSSSRWHHVILHVTDHMIAVSVDDIEVYNDTGCLSAAGLPAGMYNVSVGGDGFTGQVSQLNIWSSDATTTATSTCFSDVTGDVLSWRQFQDSEGTFVISASKCDDFDNCESSPCANNGNCTDEIDSFTCSCPSGFTGNTCGINIDDCIDNSCQNGATCLDEVNGYTCQCTGRYTGSFCEILIVDGGWTVWEPWSVCSVTCGAGVHTRHRYCTEPVPQNGGDTCSGDDTQQEECTMSEQCYNECGEDPQEVENGHLNCTWTGAAGTTRSCSPYCDSGYVFDSDLFIDDVVCGPETGYLWNIRNDENPYLQLPSCTPIQMANDNVMVYEGEYNDLDANVTTGYQDDVTHIITSRLNDVTSKLDCVKQGQCLVKEIDVKEPGARNMSTSGLTGRRRRSSSYVNFVIQISCSPSTDVQECYDLLVIAYNTFQLFVNQTMFTVQFNNVNYDVMWGTTTVNGYVTCDPGLVAVDYFCVKCGTGTYLYNDYCKRCPRGTYQDEAGQTYCKSCPDGWTTSGLQARSSLLCDVSVPDDTVEFAAWTVAVVVVILVLVFALTTLSIYVFRKRCQNKSKTEPESEKSDEQESMAMRSIHQWDNALTHFNMRKVLPSLSGTPPHSSINTKPLPPIREVLPNECTYSQPQNPFDSTETPSRPGSRGSNGKVHNSVGIGYIATSHIKDGESYESPPPYSEQ